MLPHAAEPAARRIFCIWPCRVLTHGGSDSRSEVDIADADVDPWAVHSEAECDGEAVPAAPVVVALGAPIGGAPDDRIAAFGARGRHCRRRRGRPPGLPGNGRLRKPANEARAAAEAARVAAVGPAGLMREQRAQRAAHAQEAQSQLLEKDKVEVLEVASLDAFIRVIGPCC